MATAPHPEYLVSEASTNVTITSRRTKPKAFAIRSARRVHFSPRSTSAADETFEGPSRPGLAMPT
jgi:hypothetical protein